jgi:hypothetical protein
VESLKLSVILSQSCSEKHTTCQTPDPFSSDSESGGDLPRFFRRFSSFLLWRFSFAFFFWNGIKLLLLRVSLHEFGIILTLSTPISAATWQETMLNQLWCRMAPARSFSVYFGMFHLLTKFRTISKAVLSYTVGLQGFSIKTSVFHLWYSCTEYKEAPDGIQYMVTWSLYSVKETGVEQYKNTLLRIQYLRRPNNDLVRSKHVAEHEIYAAINWSRAWQKNVWLYLAQQEARYKHEVKCIYTSIIWHVRMFIMGKSRNLKLWVAYSRYQNSHAAWQLYVAVKPL